MKIVIATGIYPPQIGGPAQYAWGLAEALRTQNHDVKVVTFSTLLRIPTGVRHVVVALKLIPAI